MRKIVALFTAMAFALTLGVAFAEEKAPAASTTAPAATEKAPAKVKKSTKKVKHVKKQKKEAAAPAAAPATK